MTCPPDWFPLMKKFFISILLAPVLLILTFALVGADILGIYPTTIVDWTPALQTQINGGYTIEADLPNLLGAPDGSYAGISDSWQDGPTCLSVSLPTIVSPPVSGTVVISATAYIESNGGDAKLDMSVAPYLNHSVNSGGWTFLGSGFSKTHAGPVGSIKLCSVKLFTSGNPAVMIDAVEVYGEAETCSTVPNPDFKTDDTWTRYSPNAVITNSTLTLTDGDVALQNLSGLAANSNYTAVVSVTNIISGPISLNLSLGEVARTLEISTTGLYSTTLSTPAHVGSYQYALWNQSDEGDIVLDYTCLSLDTAGPGGEQYECIAPTNGTFETASGWEYHRGAEWVSPSNWVDLPATEQGLVYSAGDYDLPALDTGEYLLLGFDSASVENDGGGISARVGNLVDENIGNYSNYPNPYRFELDLSNLAGTDDHHVSVANPGTAALTGTNSSDVWVDNVCIFVSDRPMQLPYPIDPNGIDPVDFGYGNINSCADVDSIWASFGVNMAQYRADYAAGFSFWDPTEWLVAAIFVTLGDWSCLFMAAFLGLMNGLEYLINNFLNVGNWLIRSFPAFATWLWLWLQWLGTGLTNLSNSYGSFLAAWANWIGDALSLTSGTIGVTLAAISGWLGDSLVNLSNGYGNFLADWSNWIGTSLANLSSWIGATLANTWNWLATYLFNLNGLKTIVNWLIAAWNTLVVAIGQLISDIISYAIIVWNNGLYPLLLAIFSYFAPLLLLAQFFGVVLDLFGVSAKFFLAIIEWVLTNTINLVRSPLDLYNGFSTGVNSTGFDELFVCSDNNVWCYIFMGVQVVNDVLGATILYPLVIIGIILVTIVVWGKRFEEFMNFVMVTLRDL